MKRARVIAVTLGVLLIFNLVGPVSATNGSTLAELFYRNIKITLNGKEVETTDANGASVEPFIINGTTYLPVRAVSEALGLDVEWDSQTSTVVLTKPGEVFLEKTVLSQLEVTEYTYENDTSKYYILAIKNNSDFNLHIDVSEKFFNESGESVLGATAIGEAFERGTEILFAIPVDKEIVTMEYSFDVSEMDERYYECGDSCLSYEYVTVSNKNFVSVTNNGDKAVSSVQAQVLFFSGDEVVGYDYGFYRDANNELKPGYTFSEQMDTDSEFDSYKIFVHGVILK